MKEITVINKISNLIENINYKSLYVEINTDNNKYIIEKKGRNKIEFSTEKEK